MRNLLTFIFLLSLPLVLSNCKKEIDPDTHFDIYPKENDVVENYVFKGRVVINAHRYDNLIIQDCSFEDIHFAGLILYNVKKVTVRNCTFKNIKGHAIQVGSNQGVADKIIIENCIIEGSEKNGIFITEWGTNVTVRNCTVTNSASKTGDNDGYFHGINVQGRNFVIEKNKVTGIGHVNGDGIHVETNGQVNGNTIFEVGHSGIAYENRKSANDSQVVIENNIIYDNPQNAFVARAVGEDELTAKRLVIRFNTMIQNSNKGLVVIPDNIGDCSIMIAHNILINPLMAKYYGLNVPADIHMNLTAQGDIGFVNYRDRDLHIRIDSQANGFSKGYTDYPADDLDGERRPQIDLDAGADEVK